MAWKTSYYHFDAVGSTRGITDSDQNFQASYRQTAFGEQLTEDTPVANPFRFVGQFGYYFDGDTGLFLVRQRVYDANLTRWIGQDPARSDHNLFRYTKNSPLNSVDPAGLEDVFSDLFSTDGSKASDAIQSEAYLYFLNQEAERSLDPTYEPPPLAVVRQNRQEFEPPPGGMSREYIESGAARVAAANARQQQACQLSSVSRPVALIAVKSAHRAS